MENRTKESKLDSVINIILIFIIILISSFIYIIIKSGKSTTAEVYKEQENVTLSSIKEKQNIIENKETLVIPLIETETTISKQYVSSNVKNNKYYYNQLDTNAKVIYDTVEKNLENMKSGKYTIKLPDSVSEILESENGEEELDRSFQSAWDALIMDRVDTFYIDSSKISLLIKKTTYGTRTTYQLEIQPTDDSGYLVSGLNNKETINSVLSYIENLKTEIISNLSGTTYDIILQVHDWIIDNLEYDTEMTNANIYNIYGAFVNKSAVCEGYAEAFKYILDELEIPCILVVGKGTNSAGATENHEWNYVKIYGKWYAVDATWDDPIVSGVGYVTNSTKHKYFLKGSNTMNKNHIAEGQFSEKGQLFVYPDLQVDDY